MRISKHSFGNDISAADRALPPDPNSIVNSEGATDYSRAQWHLGEGGQILQFVSLYLHETHVLVIHTLSARQS